LQSRIEALQFERDQLTNRGSTDSNQDIAYWKEKYINLEASLDNLVKTSIVNNLILIIYQTKEIKIKDSEREKAMLIRNLSELEEKVKGLMKDNNLLSDRLRGFSEIEVRLQESLRIRDSLESQKVKLQENIRFHETKLREYEVEIERIKKTVGTGDDFKKVREKEIIIQNLVSEVDQLRTKCKTLEDRHSIEIENTVRNKIVKTILSVLFMSNRNMNFRNKRLILKEKKQNMKQLWIS